MINSTPFFAGFHRILFGRPARPAHQIIQDHLEVLRRASLCQLATIFEPWIPPEQLAPGPGQRRRRFPVAVTFWAFLSQTLNPVSPCRDVLRKVQAWCAAHKAVIPDTNTGGYCKARQRLDSKKLRSLHQHTALRLQQRVTSSQLWQGRRVKVVDGTGVSMPDTPANQKVFPQPSSQKRGCGFPVAKIVGCFCLASGALLDWVEDIVTKHECGLLPRLWHVFDPGDILMTDRGFCSYAVVTTLAGRGVDTVMRLHQMRRKDFRQGKYIGKNERLVTWEKPQQPRTGTSPSEWELLPESIRLRYVKITITIPGFRTREIILVTTLTDPVEVPAQALGELYLRRWSVELFFRDIKITLGMDVLRCLAPEMVKKEIIMHAITYNLIRSLMQEAAALYQVDLTRISFKGTVDTLRQWSHALNAAGEKPRILARLKTQLLELLAEDLVPLRPDRTEPRAKKRRPKNHQFLTKPRRDMVVTAHRNHYRTNILKPA